MRNRAFFLATILAVLFPAPAALAQWLTGGLPIATGPGNQTMSGAASDGAGGAFIAWNDATTARARLVRIDGSGYTSPGWPAAGLDVIGVESRVLAGPVSDGTGGVILFATATGGAFAGVRAFRFDANGAVPLPWSAAGQQVLDVVPLAAKTLAIPNALGGAYLLWSVDQTTCPGHDCSSTSTLRAMRVFADGTIPTGPEWPRTVDGTYVANADICCQLSWTAFPDGDGGLVAVTGHDFEGSTRVVHVGATSSSRSFGSQLLSRGCLLPGGDLLIVTSDNPFFGDAAQNMHFYRLTPSLADAPGWPTAGVTFGDNGVVEQLEQLIPDGGSGAFLSYRSLAPGEPEALHALHVTAGPSTLSLAWPTPGPEMPRWSGTLAGGAGGLISSGFDVSTGTIRAFQLDAAGQLAPGMSPQGVPLSPPSTGVYLGPPVVIEAGVGSAIAVWTDLRSGDFDVFAQRIPLTGVVSVQVAGASAEAIPGGVRVTWWLEDGLASTLVVERGAGDAGWQSLGPLSSVSFDRAVYEDRDVSAGTRYTYRLRATGAAGPLGGSEVSVDYSPLRATTLLGFVPSPANGSPRVRFELGNRGMKELQLFDVSGRLVARHDVSGLAPGLHEFDAGPLAPGLYTIRLHGPSETRTSRGVVLL